MDRDFNNFPPSYMDCSMGMPPQSYEDSMFNPIMQYEHAYYYYRYLCMQMEYKIKCKEYDKICNFGNSGKKNE